jgi:hypothetical protein
MATLINADTSDGLKLTSDTSGQLELQSAGSTKVTMDTSGNVGIGGTPSEPLSVFRTGGQEEGINIRNTSSGNGSRLTFETTRSDDSSVQDMAAIQVYAVAGYDSAANSDAIMTFQTQDSGTTAERMRIDSSGNVMMGTTTRSNNEKVTIYQSVAQAMGISVRTSGGPALGNYESSDDTHATYWTFGRDNQTTGNYVFAYGGALRGSINLSTGTYTAISDSRLKKNITNITYGLNEVMAFRPVTYLMNEEDDTAKKHLGFIAQEVKTLVDEAVDDLIDPDTQFYMLDKGGLVPVLVKAIQEQQAIIETLTTRIEALEAK